MLLTLLFNDFPVLLAAVFKQHAIVDFSLAAAVVVQYRYLVPE